MAAEAQMVKRWLSNLREPWLLILDNADNPDLNLSPHFPVGCRGTVLITSRNPECGAYATEGMHGLGPMEEEEAITLLLRSGRSEEPSDKAAREKAKDVVSILGRLALAIDQAGGLIRQGLYTMEEYCGEVSRRPQELLTQKLFNVAMITRIRFMRRGRSRCE